ncbi:uncharacterized protein EV420DRAFT_1763584 [Desarmillaria tabescens]|uniref:Uncharacterized protein n=1 Tax=Armillaria tabescens TaxID=1929756 RepID=A0AA39KG46_ARMTA|nr:uncharacterized protein EV420DRAFT_1763584 [Desarmillaria tabescens]KAK0459129.1 hypothetical protein EV420DRAFT_1763584 [Desarmillaria tabescens]
MVLFSQTYNHILSIMTDQCALDANGNLKSPSKFNFYHDADDDVPMAGPGAAPKPQISGMYYSTAVYIPVPYRQPSSKSIDGTVTDQPSPVTVPWLYGRIPYTVRCEALAGNDNLKSTKPKRKIVDIERGYLGYYAVGNDPWENLFVESIDGGVCRLSRSVPWALPMGVFLFVHRSFPASSSFSRKLRFIAASLCRWQLPSDRHDLSLSNHYPESTRNMTIHVPNHSQRFPGSRNEFYMETTDLGPASKARSAENLGVYHA